MNCLFRNLEFLCAINLFCNLEYLRGIDDHMMQRPLVMIPVYHNLPHLLLMSYLVLLSQYWRVDSAPSKYFSGSSKVRQH